MRALSGCVFKYLQRSSCRSLLLCLTSSLDVCVVVMMRVVFVFPLLAVCVLCVCLAYKPVIIVHGLFDSSSNFNALISFINAVRRHLQ